MSNLSSLRIYLDEIPLRRAEKGNFNLINRIKNAFHSRDFSVELRLNSSEERLRSAAFGGYSLFHMDEPFHPRALTMRKAYYYPFWRIEASGKRWEWEVAKSRFEPDAIEADAAARFCNFWRKRLFGALDLKPERTGLVYIPLQGRLLDRRSFQTHSPVEMIKAILAHDTSRNVYVGFHPGETYTKDEFEAIRRLVERSPRLEISSEPMEDLLGRCDYVATENSSAALAGYFYHKPAVLFAQIDFHHIAANVAATGAANAIQMVPDLAPDYDRYLFWFLKQTAINGGAESAEAQILDCVRRHGWVV